MDGEGDGCRDDTGVRRTEIETDENTGEKRIRDCTLIRPEGWGGPNYQSRAKAKCVEQH